MTIDDLIERLEDYRDEFGGGTEVRLMTQPNWPFENALAGICSSAEIKADADDRDDDIENDVVIYLLEGEQIGYGTKAAWDFAHR